MFVAFLFHFLAYHESTSSLASANANFIIRYVLSNRSEVLELALVFDRAVGMILNADCSVDNFVDHNDLLWFNNTLDQQTPATYEPLTGRRCRPPTGDREY